MYKKIIILVVFVLNLAFDTGLNWSQIQSDAVIWEINSLKVEEYVGDCKSQSNWLKTEN